jgi:hypothetical protein
MLVRQCHVKHRQPFVLRVSPRDHLVIRLPVAAHVAATFAVSLPRAVDYPAVQSRARRRRPPSRSRVSVSGWVEGSVFFRRWAAVRAAWLAARRRQLRVVSDTVFSVLNCCVLPRAPTLLCSPICRALPAGSAILPSVRFSEWFTTARTYTEAVDLEYLKEKLPDHCRIRSAQPLGADPDLRLCIQPLECEPKPGSRRWLSSESFLRAQVAGGFVPYRSLPPRGGLRCRYGDSGGI